MNYKKRLKLVRKRMLENELEYFLISNQRNVYYISGLSSSNAFILLGQEDAFLITDFRYIEAAENKSGDFFNIVDFARRSLAQVIEEILPAKAPLKIAFEARDMSYYDYQRLSNQLPSQMELEPVQGWIEDLRKIKDEAEISLIRKAQKITEKALEETMNFIELGRTEREIKQILENFLQTFGAHGLAFSTIVAAGKRGSLPHAIPSDEKIEEGDFILIDVGSKYGGYCSDMTRTFALGHLEDYKRKIYNTVLKAQTEAIKEIRAGAACKSIDKISRDIIKEAGYADYFGHGLGHSLGLEVHEEPAFSPLSKDSIEKNMLMTVEPGIYLPDSLGLRIEDLLLVTDQGFENLTEFKKELIIL